MHCPQCGLRQPTAHRYCVSCGSSLPREILARGRRPKVTRWFWGMPVTPSDPEHAALRVSRYLEEIEVRSAEGSVRIPSHHVRFSIWVDDRARCAVSIPDDEAEQLARFLLASVPNGNGSDAPEEAVA